MTTDWQTTTLAEAQRTLADYGIPGMVVAVAYGDGPAAVMAVGTDAAGAPLAPASVLPVASITKPAVALGLLRLVAAGEVALDDPVDNFLPTVESVAAGVTLRDILCHVGGAAVDLQPKSAPYRQGLSWESVREPLLHTPPTLAPHRMVHYSNIGIGLVALVIESITATPVQAALRTLVYTPLGIEAWLGEEPPRPPSRITGDLGDHAGTELEPYNSPWYRTLGFPWGGMFTTAAGALAIVRAFSDACPAFLPESMRAEATRDNTGGLAGGFPGWMEWSPCPWGLGVEVRGRKWPHATARCSSPRTFGHIGATGAVAWCDPEAGLSWAIVGTRTWGPWVECLSALAETIYLAHGLAC